mgnify:CR=1 FL=1
MVPPHGLGSAGRTNLNLFLQKDSRGNHFLTIHDLFWMCANVNQMYDGMCTKDLTTYSAVMLLSQESTTEQQTTEIDTICG